MTDSIEAIHDSSHARALLKGWLRKYKIESSKLLDKEWPEIATSRSKAFEQVVNFMRKMIGDGMIFDIIRSNQRGKRKEYVAFSLEALELTPDTKEIGLVLSVPVCVTTVDSKYPNIEPKIAKPFLLSEHLLCRVIQRSNCRSLTELATFFIPLLTLLFEGKMIDRSRSENLICLFEDGYYATTFDEDEGWLVFKTWVSADSWTPKNEAKISLLAERLGNEGLAVLISESEFERSALLTPEDYLKDAIRVG
jgi:hypothetical protein